MNQEFAPPRINGGANARAHAIAETIAAQDYHAANFYRERRLEGTPKVDYKVTKNSSQWGAAQEALQSAISMGRQTRMQYGSGLDVLQANLKSGAEPDLIENSKKRMARVWSLILLVSAVGSAGLLFAQGTQLAFAAG